MNTRLNGILTTLAQQYAFHLLKDAPTGDARFPYFADGLANNGLLVLLADVPANNYDFFLRSWMDGYSRLYSILANNLFPSFRSINLGAADNMRPPVLVLQGEAVAVIQILAGYIVPYISMRQQTNTISEAEIRGLMTYILDELEAEELDRASYNFLWRECGQVIRQLITLPIRQFSLTSMKKPLFQQTHIQPEKSPERRPRPVPPSTLPETSKAVNGMSKTDSSKTQPMPIWFNIDGDSKKDRFMPRPRLPDDESS